MRLQGAWISHPQHGVQFEVAACFLDTPTDPEGILRYLSSGIFRGIGATYAKRIVDEFGVKTLEILESNPERLLAIEGIGDKRLEKITTSWKEQQAIRAIMLFLQSHEVSPASARRIYRTYGEETMERMKENPYALATDVAGIGFASADQIAQKMGFPKESTLRIDAGILFVLQTLAQEGHTCAYPSALEEKATQLLGVSVQERLQHVIEEGRIVYQEIPSAGEGAPTGKLFLRKYWICEQAIAHHIHRLLSHSSSLRSVDGPRAVAWAEAQLSIQFASQQSLAVETALREKILVITGGPGTGKSTITKAILAIYRRLTSRILLAAPTGRAAKRLAEITHFSTSTLHSLLKFSFQEGRFFHNKENPLHCDLLLIDEASMLDTQLAASLLAAVPSSSRLILIGDVCQLPSVGPGAVLKDLITSGQVPVITLHEIYRQAAGSRIVTNAHLVNQGLFPELAYEPGSDFVFSKAEEPQEVMDSVVDWITKKLPRRFHPIDQIQVLAPMKRGAIGIEQLNYRLQRTLNPNWKEGQRFAVGDKVMQLRNDYDKEVYNGDIGKVLSIEEDLVVAFDDKQVLYTSACLDDITLAYAISVHKFQGSESPCIIMVVHPSHFMLLQRNLLYTAITRGRKMVVLIGSAKAIGMALHRQDGIQRTTHLCEAIQSACVVKQEEPPLFDATCR